MIRAALFCVLIAFVCAPVAAAHRVGVPVTTIEWNAKADNWEIVHRVSAHDLERYFAGKEDLQSLYSTPSGIDALGRYASRAFVIDGEEVELTYVGAELDQDQVWIYFEMTAPDQALRVDSNLLMGSGETSFALVNAKGQGGVQSLIFAPNDGPKAIDLKRGTAP